VVFAPLGQQFIYVASQAKLDIGLGQAAEDVNAAQKALIDTFKGYSGLRPLSSRHHREDNGRSPEYPGS
jgi:hypothetical protein